MKTFLTVHWVSLLLCLAAPLRALDLPEPLQDGDFLAVSAEHAALGRLLFYDKILSGNQNISCGTCHHHDHAGTDGVSLAIGEGGTGLGPKRVADPASPIRKRVPRNAPALWNLGHKDVRFMFLDGRLSHSPLYGNGFNSPAQEWLPQGLGSLLAAQALFPLTSQAEMAGNIGENEVIGAVMDRIDLGWPIIAKRVRTIPAYGEMFVAAFEHIDTPEDVTITEIGNAIAAFIASEWRNHDSPFDRYIAGDETALSPAQERGLRLFYAGIGCADCHSGPLLSDQGFHALGLPQFGPGRTRPWDPMPRDLGRMIETNRLEDAYRFRTPFLRNVALTAPYGHNGAMPTLEMMVRHHLNPEESRAAWTPDLAGLPKVPWLSSVDFVIQQDALEMARQSDKRDVFLPEVTEADIADIVAFLHALTGESALTRPLGRPDTVPSGLPVD